MTIDLSTVPGNQRSNGGTRAALYVRVSTDEQAKEGHASLDVQEDACRRYAEGHEWPVVDVYADADSGTNPNRPAYKRLLADALAGNFEAIVVFNSSRWGRDHIEAGSALRTLEGAGVKVYSTTGDIGGHFITGVMSLFSEEYSLALSRTIRPNLARIAERGDWPGANVPVGYVRDAERRVVVDVAKAPLVQSIFKMAQDGASIAACAKEMRRRGHPISNTCMREVLTNPFYIGRVRWLDPNPEMELHAAKRARVRGQRAYKEYPGSTPRSSMLRSSKPSKTPSGSEAVCRTGETRDSAPGSSTVVTAKATRCGTA